MPLVYITGVSGTGKTTVCRELIARGFTAYDIERDGLVEWRTNKTHKKLRFPRLRNSLKLHRWYRSHIPYLYLQRVSQLKNKAEETGKTVYLCGSAYGEDQAHKYFDTIIVLTADLDTIKKRIAHRRNNAYGKSVDELNDIEKWYAHAETNYGKQNVVHINTTQSLDNVINSILEIT